MGQGTDWRLWRESRQDLETSMLWGNRQERRLTPWSLAQCCGIPGQPADSGGGEMNADECLFPPCKVKENKSVNA